LSEPEHQHPGMPDTITLVSFALLGVVAVLLLLPLFGLARPPLWIFAALLAARLGLQFWRSSQQPQTVRRRAAGWVLDVALIGLLLWVSFFQK
jgi:4-hydroxybenzoate polyprenyltransferase